MLLLWTAIYWIAPDAIETRCSGHSPLSRKRPSLSRFRGSEKGLWYPVCLPCHEHRDQHPTMCLAARPELGCPSRTAHPGQARSNPVPASWRRYIRADISYSNRGMIPKDPKESRPMRWTDGVPLRRLYSDMPCHVSAGDSRVSRPEDCP